MVLRGLTIDQKPLKGHLEAIGHREAFEYVQTLVAEGAPLTEQVVKDIHSLVLSDKKDDRGVYRKVPIRIMGAANKPAQPFMEQWLVDYAQSQEDIVTKMARFNIAFESIHPFIDGNGRIDIKFSDRLAYYKAFDDFHAKGSLSAMEDLFVRYLNERLDMYLSLLSLDHVE